MPTPVHILNGPNLNLLGEREPATYGATTLEEIRLACQKRAAAHGFGLEFLQSNHEGGLIDAVHRARRDSAGLIINPAGFTSTSIALLDALLTVETPIVEVHLTNLHHRETWRHHSFVSKAASVVIMGAGPHGYLLAIDHLASLRTVE